MVEVMGIIEFAAMAIIAIVIVSVVMACISALTLFKALCDDITFEEDDHV